MADVKMKATFTETNQSFKASFGIVTRVLPDPYEGPYEVTPTVEGFTLPTKTKSMAKDLAVLEIPYAEVSNISGTTVVIAS